MNDLEYYIKLPYQMKIFHDKKEEGYVASFPDLTGCLTCAETMDEVIGKATDAKKEWICAALEEGLSIPEPLNT